MPRPKIGDRVRMTGIMPNDPDPLPVGLEGTVVDVTPPGYTFQQIDVDWEVYHDEQGAHRRTLFLLPDDPFIILG